MPGAEKNSKQKIYIGTRTSKLALWQSTFAKHLLEKAHSDLNIVIHTITSRGDIVLDKPLPLVGGKGLFTAELEESLFSGKIDLAVHSLKDLPTTSGNGLIIGAFLQRAFAADALVSKKRHTLRTLPKHAKLGTSSIRRASQILRERPDLNIIDIRGNVDTRLRKVLIGDDNGYDATILAYAGLDRLGRLDAVTEVLSFDLMLPAPGQGAMAIQCRDENWIVSLLESINHSETELATTAERAFLSGLGGGCSLPIAAFGSFEEGEFVLEGRVMAQDGSKRIDVQQRSVIGSVDEAYNIGSALAKKAISIGANDLLSKAQ